MKILALLLICLTASLRGSPDVPYLPKEFDPAKWPSVTLKLSQAGTLKDVFDSGLRPYRYPSLETSLIAAKHVRLKIELASGKQLPEFQVEKFQITPFADGEIRTFEGFTPKLTLEEARKEMAKWLPYGNRTAADLDAYLKAVEKDFMDFDDPYRGTTDGCGTSWKEPGWSKRGGGPGCNIWFKKAGNETHPLHLYFKLSWGPNRTTKDSVFYQTPIPPPPGYEHVSMEAPKNFGPDSTVGILRAKGEDIGESPEAKQARAMGEAKAAGRANGETAPGHPNRQSPGTPGIWYLIGVIAFAVAAFLGWRSFRKPKDASQ